MNEAIKHRNLNKELEIVEFINKLLTSTGWGKFSIEQYDLQKKIIVKVENSFMAKAYGKTSYNCDFILSGFLAGGLSGALESNFDAQEKKCISSGNNYCEIEIYKS